MKDICTLRVWPSGQVGSESRGEFRSKTSWVLAALAFLGGIGTLGQGKVKPVLTPCCHTLVGSTSLCCICRTNTLIFLIFSVPSNLVNSF